jgi:MFS family permease
LLVGGQAASTIGDACYAVALPWYVLAGHGGAAALGTTLAAYGVARAVAMPAGGLLCDRLGARRVLLLVDVLRAALIGGLALQVTLRPPSLVTLALFSALAGACQGTFVPGHLRHLRPHPRVTAASRRPAAGTAHRAEAPDRARIDAFPLAGALTAAAILFGLSRKAFRSFAAEPGGLNQATGSAAFTGSRPGQEQRGNAKCVL